MMPPVDQFFICACFGEGLRVSHWPDDGEFYLSMWAYRHHGKASWRQRLRHIWKIVRDGEPWDDECLLRREDAEKLKDFLCEALGERKP